MNRNSSGLLTLNKTITGFLNFKMAEGLAKRSTDVYEQILQKWAAYEGDKEIGKITREDVTAYFGWLRNEYIPQRYI